MDQSVLSTEVIKEPVNKKVVEGTKKVTSSTKYITGSGRFIWPVPNYRYCSRWYGGRHKGVDICASAGTPIYASAGGTVAKAGYNKAGAGTGYGYSVIINHGGGYSSVYAHCLSLTVSAGQTVKQGQLIGYLGSTGRSTGNHCHFEIRLNGSYIPPQNVFPGKNKPLRHACGAPPPLKKKKKGEALACRLTFGGMKKSFWVTQGGGLRCLDKIHKKEIIIMATPHISAEKGDFAKTVLMPGDPLRAKFIADTFLKGVRQVTDVRGMLGFTGTYEGRPISVMGSGMGMPSIGIYSYELFKFYDVDNIIRIGSAGSYTADAKLFDTVLAAGAVSESNYARVQSGNDHDITFPSETLNDKLRASAKKQGIKLIEGNIHSSDVFYRQSSDAKPTYWELLRDERGCLCVEMESFALFANAEVLGKNAACLLTISDSFVSPEITTAEQRQKSFTDMMKVALGAEY